MQFFKKSPGWWYTYPSDKYESVGMMKFPYGKTNNVPKHQPDYNG
jgi:hypothetical protein